MNNEMTGIISNLQNTLGGQPWYGRAVYEILQEVDSSKVYSKPNEQSHSMIDLLYHMVTWAEFVQHRIKKEPIADMAAFDSLDWRAIDPTVHTWEKGLAALQAAHTKIIEMLQIRKDVFLEEIVDYRDYNFRVLLNGLIQHNIYHLGQVVYAAKLLGSGN